MFGKQMIAGLLAWCMIFGTNALAAQCNQPTKQFLLGSNLFRLLDNQLNNLLNFNPFVCSFGELTALTEYVAAFQHAVSGTYVLRAKGVGLFDPVIQVRKGTCNGEVLACDDNSGGKKDALITLDLQAGETYIVRMVDKVSQLLNVLIPVDISLTDVLPPIVTSPPAGSPSAPPAGSPSAPPAGSPSSPPAGSPSAPPAGAPSSSPEAPAIVIPPAVYQLCLPKSGMRKQGPCKTNRQICAEYGIKLKWVGKTCKKGPGGCQCADFCAYRCKKRCNKDSKCVWVSNKCYNRANMTEPAKARGTCNLPV